MLDAGSIRAAAELVRRARRIAVLTGAGLSTPSGIPDFRSADVVVRGDLAEALRVVDEAV